MDDHFGPARALAKSIRFSGDSDDPKPPTGSSTHFEKFRALFKHNELLICEAITPALHRAVTEAADRLRVPRGQIDAFVCQEPEIQANCVVGGGETCLIRFSSGLVNLLSPEELQFVAGHEIGHHLLNHGERHPDGHDSLEQQMSRRASEISADRLGLIACASLDVGIRALMKSVSGLPDHLIRFDVGRYLTQIGDSVLSTFAQPHTHPSMGVRCRALLWFASAPNGCSGQVSERDRQSVDERVTRDLNRFMDASVNLELERSERNLAMWIAITSIITDLRFSKAEQSWFSDRFGDNATKSVVALVSDRSGSELKALVEERRCEALSALRTLLPQSWTQRLERATRLAETMPHG